MSELEIPEVAIRATYGDPLTERTTRRTVVRVLELGAPHMLAAELRRMASHPNRIHTTDGDFISVAAIRARADELDGGA